MCIISEVTGIYFRRAHALGRRLFDAQMVNTNFVQSFAAVCHRRISLIAIKLIRLSSLGIRPRPSEQEQDASALPRTSSMAESLRRIHGANRPHPAFGRGDLFCAASGKPETPSPRKAGVVRAPPIAPAAKPSLATARPRLRQRAANAAIPAAHQRALGPFPGHGQGIVRVGSRGQGQQRQCSGGGGGARRRQGAAAA